jgi:hypothetical protein
MLHRFRHASIRDDAIALVLVAMVFRALIPSGFMLGGGHGTTLTVEFCSGAGSHPLIVHYGDDGRPAGPTQHHGQDGHCPFAASALLAPPPMIVAAVAVGPVAVPRASRHSDPILSPERARRPGARAPPKFA